MSDEKADHEEAIGYGKPPKATRFKPGRSGNPRGRPKGRVSFERKLEQAFGKTIGLTVNGEHQRMSIEDAAILRLTQNVLTASPEKQIAILKFVLALRLPVVETEFPYENLSDEELDLMIALIAKATGEAAPYGLSSNPLDAVISHVDRPTLPPEPPFSYGENVATAEAIDICGASPTQLKPSD